MATRKFRLDVKITGIGKMGALEEIPLHKLRVQSLAERSWAPLNDDTGALESGDLRIGASLTAADNSTSVTHPSSWRGADSGNKSNDGLVLDVVALQELGRILLCTTADLTNHDDTLGLVIFKEDAQAVNEVRAGERITTDSNNKGLAEPGLSSLVHGLVGKGSRARNDANATALVDKSRHDTNFTLALRTKKLALFNLGGGAERLERKDPQER